MSRFDSYATKYSCIHMRRENGILEMRFHTDNGPLRWGLGPHGELPDAFADVARDRDNRVVILTGTGDEWSGVRATPGQSAIGPGLTVQCVRPCALGGPRSADEPAEHRGAGDFGDQRPGVAARRNSVAVGHRARRGHGRVPGLRALS